jgi:hypothetical protein
MQGTWHGQRGFARLDTGSSGKTECGRLDAGSMSDVGGDDSKDLRRRDKGIRFLTVAETAGTGSKQDKDLAD